MSAPLLPLVGGTKTSVSAWARRGAASEHRRRDRQPEGTVNDRRRERWRSRDITVS